MSSVAHRPDLTLAEAADVARVFGLSGPLRPLPSDRDQNFAVGSPEAAVLKIVSPLESEEERALQSDVLRHLEAAGFSGVPRLLRTKEGATEAVIERGYRARALGWLDGVPLRDVTPKNGALCESLGQWIAGLGHALEDFEGPGLTRCLEWDLRRGLDVVSARLSDMDPPHRAVVAALHERVASELAPLIGALRLGVIHGDANDDNVLMSVVAAESPRVRGIIDFGDMTRSWLVADPAIAAAYMMLSAKDPVAAAASVARGYSTVRSLTDEEADAFFELALLRLMVSVSMAARQVKDAPEDPYLTITATPALEVLPKLAQIPPALARARVRAALGFSPSRAGDAVSTWLHAQRTHFAPVVPTVTGTLRAEVVDFSITGPSQLTEDEDLLARRQRSEGVDALVGRYDEVRRCYGGALFATASDEFPERRTVHLGIDLFVPAGTPVFAPLAGIVEALRDNAGPLDYGPTVILRHEPKGGPTFFTLYGHLARSSLKEIEVGQRVARGEAFATIGTDAENGGWSPHVHVQVIVDLLGRDGEFPGVAAPSERATWLALCPDPSPLLGLSKDARAERPLTQEALLRRRAAVLPRNLSLAYDRPLTIVRGEGAYLMDDEGQEFLDLVNNVCHVGHCHPRVVAAGQHQMALLNTNTRYLHPTILEYAERLVASFPDPLSVCYLVCSGSEANELALRLAKTHTGRRDVVCLDAAYHGNTPTLIDISPYKHAGLGGRGAPLLVHVVPLPDGYRGRHRVGDGDLGALYAQYVTDKVEELRSAGTPPAAFIAESLPGCGGQIELPEGYLRRCYAAVRACGGVVIADEVQVGFGRVGERFWGFELGGVVPDIVTLGKPIGNGHPMSAVITTAAIARSFENGMEFFNTFGGNPVSCAIGLAVLDVLEDEQLVQNAVRVGAHLKAGLRELAQKFPLIGDVRGRGLFLGVELVEDRETKTPSARAARYVANRCRDLGILISTDGPDHNVLKIKPPLVISLADADRVLKTLARILAESPLRGA